MCGIFGFINLNQSNELTSSELDMLKINSDKASKRGPEHSEWEKFSHGYLGFHRLAINGLDSLSNQPLKKYNCTLICNGEIYNYKYLYKTLNITPKTNSDCEVIIDMYKRFGIDYTLENLDGVFAFILIDHDTNNVHVARDPFGVRPLYFCFQKDKMFFSSEFMQLNNWCVNNSSYGQFSPGSYLKLNLDSKKLINKKYHNFSLQTNNIPPVPIGKDALLSLLLSDSCSTIFNCLCASVQKRVANTERPIACLLSGGLDSSLIAAIVKKIIPENIELETYSIGMPGGEDLKYAKMVADHIGSKHTEVIMTEKEFLKAIPNVILNISSYDTTTVRASVGNYLIGKYISENSSAKVIFNGDGADELMGGYLYFHNCPNSQIFDFECKRLLRNIHFFDVLRSDRCISSHGLESRTPFLDRSFVNAYLEIPDFIRNHNETGKIEKYLLRRSIETNEPSLLPNEVLWRKKEAFSDGVSSTSNSWYETIQKFVKNNTYVIPMDKLSINNPSTDEQKYYRKIFEEHYPNNGIIVPYFWMPQFCKATDSSARTLEVYNKKSNNNLNETK
jgi:asparagine synthase (glutamine-hydrolysing)